ncbi:MAG: hypothetical protein ACOX69_04025 [Coriobacteriales bacterium]|jgi:hypothetical protein
MEKAFTAIGAFYNEEGTELVEVPDDELAIYKKVDEIIAGNSMGNPLSEENLAILRSYLPAIGSDEQSQDDNGSLQGKGTVTKKISGCGIEVEATGLLDVSSVWEQVHDRKQWSGLMKVKRLGGDAKVLELSFSFMNVSIGKGPDGKFEILYSANHTRSFTDPYHIADFDNGGTAEASRFDISKHVQWGYYMRCTCAVRTDQGTLLV